MFVSSNFFSSINDINSSDFPKYIKDIIFDFNASFSSGYADNILFDKFKH